MPSYRRYSSPAAVYHAPTQIHHFLETRADKFDEIATLSHSIDIWNNSDLDNSDIAISSVPSSCPIHKTASQPIAKSVDVTLVNKSQSPDRPHANTKPLPQSSTIHIDLRKLSLSQPLAILRERANQNAANQPAKSKILAQVRHLFQEAIKSYSKTSSCVIGDLFYWSPKGLHLNFTTDAQKWLSIDHKDWLRSISPDLNILESWKAMYIGGVDCGRLMNAVMHTISNQDSKIAAAAVAALVLNTNFHSLSTDDPMFVRFVDSCYANNSLPSGRQYRIRKIRWVSKTGIAIWFHDVDTMDAFLEKGEWYMDMLYGEDDGTTCLRKIGFRKLDELWERDCIICGKAGHKVWMHQSKDQIVHM